MLNIIVDFRDVAQSGSALHWGCSGRRFKSGHPDQRVKLCIKILHKDYIILINSYIIRVLGLRKQHISL
jgi:hypothetical protein